MLGISYAIPQKRYFHGQAISLLHTSDGLSLFSDFLASLSPSKTALLFVDREIRQCEWRQWQLFASH